MLAGGASFGRRACEGSGKLDIWRLSRSWSRRRQTLDLYAAESECAVRGRCRAKARLAGKMARALGVPRSWESPYARPQHAGDYKYSHGNLGSRTRVSRLVTSPDDYDAWQRHLNSSGSAQAALQRRAGVQAYGCDLGWELRCRSLYERHALAAVGVRAFLG